MQSRLTVHGLVVPVVERLGGQQLPKSASKRTPAGRAAGAALRVEAGCRTCTPASRCSRTPREDLAAVSRLGASATHGGRQAELVPLAIDLAISRPRVWRDDSRLLALPPPVGRGLTAAAAAAVTRRHRRRHPPPSPPSSASRLPVKRAVAARLSATPATQNDNLRKLGTLANTKLERCQQRTRTAHRTARVAGSVRAWAAGVGARCYYSGVTQVLLRSDNGGPHGAAGLQGMPAARPRPRAGDRTS